MVRDEFDPRCQSQEALRVKCNVNVLASLTKFYIYTVFGSGGERREGEIVENMEGVVGSQRSLEFSGNGQGIESHNLISL